MLKSLLAVGLLAWPLAAQAAGPGQAKPQCLHLRDWLAIAGSVDQSEHSLGRIATNHRRVVLTYGAGDQWAILMEIDPDHDLWCLLAEN